MVERDPTEFDPLELELFELLEGGRTADDPEVRRRLDAQPELARVYREVMAVRSELARLGRDARDDIAAASRAEPDEDEKRILAGFRAQMRTARPRRTRGWVLIAIAASVALALAVWSLRAARPAEGDGYLEGERAIFVLEPRSAFGTLQWNRIDRATSFDLYLWTSHAAYSAGQAARWSERGLSATSWSLPGERVREVGSELLWELRQFDASGAELARGSFVQRR